MTFKLPNGELIVDGGQVHAPIDSTPEVDPTNNFKDFFVEYANKNNYAFDEENLTIENEDDLFNQVFQMKEEMAYGKDNQILKLAKNNVDIASVAKQIAQYDSLLGNDDKEFYFQAKALETANAYQKNNPDASSDLVQQAYSKTYEDLKNQHKDTNESLFGDLSAPFRRRYEEERDGIIPKTINRSQTLKQEQLTKFSTNQESLINNAVNNPTLIEKGNEDFRAFLKEKTSIDGNQVKFIKEIMGDDKKLSRLLELYYLDGKGRLNEAVGQKVIGRGHGASNLFNSSKGNGGAKYIDTSVPH